MPSLLVPRLDVDIGTLYYRPTKAGLTLVWFPDPSTKPTHEEGTGWGAYLRDKNICARTLADNVGGRAICKGGVYVGHYGTSLSVCMCIYTCLVPQEPEPNIETKAWMTVDIPPPTVVPFNRDICTRPHLRPILFCSLFMGATTAFSNY